MGDTNQPLSADVLGPVAFKSDEGWQRATDHAERHGWRGYLNRVVRELNGEPRSDTLDAVDRLGWIVDLTGNGRARLEPSAEKLLARNVAQRENTGPLAHADGALTASILGHPETRILAEAPPDTHDLGGGLFVEVPDFGSQRKPDLLFAEASGRFGIGESKNSLRKLVKEVVKDDGQYRAYRQEFVAKDREGRFTAWMIGDLNHAWTAPLKSVEHAGSRSRNVLDQLARARDYVIGRTYRGVVALDGDAQLQFSEAAKTELARMRITDPSARRSELEQRYDNDVEQFFLEHRIPVIRIARNRRAAQPQLPTTAELLVVGGAK